MEETVNALVSAVEIRDPYTAGHQLRVATLSREIALAMGFKGEELDGHFGSCARFLIYQLSASELRLIDIRSANGPESRDDKNAFRANLINDCQVLFVASIGGPAAAKVVRAGVHPIKYPAAGSARERMESLQKVIQDSPPPWLAKVMGHDEESRIRFERSAADAG